MNKIIFMAGPVRGDGTNESKERNFEVARKFVRIFIDNKIPFYSPHLNVEQESTFMSGEASKFGWELNAEFLKRCQALSVLPGWESSNGTKTEVENATKIGLPVFYLDKEGEIQKIIDWLK